VAADRAHTAPENGMERRGVGVNGHERSGDGGAAAVEFGLIVPIMFLIIFATIDFGRLFNDQIMLTDAAREGARMAAVGRSESEVADRVNLAADPLSGVTTNWTGPCPSNAAVTATVTVTVTYKFEYLFLPGVPRPTLTGKGVMQCQG
jgi:Flp pilus assembly protein TadG